MLTVTEFARRFGFDTGGTARAMRKRVLRRLRRLQESTGKEIVVQRGAGAGRRILVRTDELIAALDDGAAQDAREIDVVANKIADTVRAMEERHTAMSLGLDDTRRRLAAAVARIGALERRLAPRTTR